MSGLPSLPHHQNVRNQHYVFRMYLKAWAPGNSIWYHTGDGNIIHRTTQKVAYEEYFYRLPDFSVNEIKRLLEFIDACSLEDAPVMRNLLANFIFPSLLEKCLAVPQDKLNEIVEIMNLLDSRLGPDTSEDFEGVKKIVAFTCFGRYNTLKKAERQKMKEYIQKCKDILEEKLHGKIESYAVPVLKQLQEGKTDFWGKNDECIDFICFLCRQYSRTKIMRDNLVAGMRSKSIEEPGINRENIAKFIPHIFSISASGVILRDIDNWEIIKLNNTTEIPFITGMQPVINISDQPSEKLMLYYPVSPQYAYLVRERATGENMEDILSVGRVDYYNRRVLEHSGGRIMGDSENIIRRYM